MAGNPYKESLLLMKSVAQVLTRDMRKFLSSASEVYTNPSYTITKGYSAVKKPFPAVSVHFHFTSPEFEVVTNGPAIGVGFRTSNFSAYQTVSVYNPDKLKRQPYFTGEDEKNIEKEVEELVKKYQTNNNVIVAGGVRTVLGPDFVPMMAFNIKKEVIHYNAFDKRRFKILTKDIPEIQIMARKKGLSIYSPALYARDSVIELTGDDEIGLCLLNCMAWSTPHLRDEFRFITYK